MSYVKIMSPVSGLKYTFVQAQNYSIYLVTLVLSPIFIFADVRKLKEIRTLRCSIVVIFRYSS